MKDPFQSLPELPGRSSQAEIIVSREADAAGAFDTSEIKHEWLGEFSDTVTEYGNTQSALSHSRAKASIRRSTKLAQFGTRRRRDNAI
jgi:hypothetical protein